MTWTRAFSRLNGTRTRQMKCRALKVEVGRESATANGSEFVHEGANERKEIQGKLKTTANQMKMNLTMETNMVLTVALRTAFHSGGGHLQL
ncbi:hypothetical protein L916_15599 [Phytophthora nicotianae]|uniref:Uncharacterized protein n=1 Tax=Phytophthora nicotianae TaxID=4792 RepID=W2IBW2_PHYNI|nr:hypothetical protein L916_15599 [Phytophthora nicotianae]